MVFEPAFAQGNIEPLGERHGHAHDHGGEDVVIGVMPVGGACWWWGIPAELPDSWRIVDGTTGPVNGAGTPPDMTDRMAVGAGNLYALGATGGSADYSHDASPNHAHGSTYNHTGAAVANHAAHVHSTPGLTVQSGLGADAAAHADTGNPLAALTHTVTQPDAHVIENDGSHGIEHGQHDLPPYAAWYFIMRVY